MSKANQGGESGYTLAQLLTVISVLLVIMTLIVPALEHEGRRADETEAISSLKTLNQMEGQYAAAYPNRGFACSLTALGGNPKLGAPNADAAQLLPDDLARGAKAGYRFAFASCAAKSYEIVATPAGKTGHRTFCIDQDVDLRVNPDGGTTCTETLR